jgi:UDP-N-acetylglucosamine 2-epimerase (non-hydrolysing)
MQHRVQKLLVIFGTRPEVIKLAPVIRELRRREEVFECRVCSTGQHREMVTQALEPFELRADIQLDAMSDAQSLGRLTSRLFGDLDAVLGAEKPDWVLVQGDTTSAMAGGVSAFYRHIKVGHVEAGLRTHNRWAPFPEEVNRAFISQVADLHFAPTSGAAENLRKMGIPETDIHVTGNTAIDALFWMRDKMRNRPPPNIGEDVQSILEGHRLLLVTGHRRESFGEGLANTCWSLKRIVNEHTDVVIVYPVHLNPNVHEPVHRILDSHPRIKLLPPVSYPALVWLMQKSHFILTDSGGIQEEAPALGKPVLILRDTTERPEAVDAGCALLVGTEPARIEECARELLSAGSLYQAMSQARNPFGDGSAAARIAALLASTRCGKKEMHLDSDLSTIPVMTPMP